MLTTSDQQTLTTKKRNAPVCVAVAVLDAVCEDVAVLLLVAVEELVPVAADQGHHERGSSAAEISELNHETPA